MNLSEFDYYLPKEQIAQYPLTERDSSRLCIVDRRLKRCEHRFFRDIVEYFRPGDIIVLNDTKVIPARLYGVKPSGGKTEILLLKEIGRNEWEALVKGMHKGVVIIKEGITANVSPFNGVFKVRFKGGDIKSLLDRIGVIALPPYIKRGADEFDKKRYQTVYADKEGAIAAPTAGLHFTDEILNAIRRKGVEVKKLTLHVGYGTFKPVREADIRNHMMDEEHYEIPVATAEALNVAKAQGRRVIAVGTTVTRALESSSIEGKRVQPGAGETTLFIYPGYNFRIVDALITNLHQPRTTPMMLAAAFAGLNLLRRAYVECQRLGYRFFSYGDAMLII